MKTCPFCDCFWCLWFNLAVCPYCELDVEDPTADDDSEDC